MARGRGRKKAKVVKGKVDHLSALPDELLHKILAHGGLRAWEVARTCILSRRWRNVWASAPSVDLRVFCGATHGPQPENLSMFFDTFLSRREPSASLDTLRLLCVPTECKHEWDDDHEEPTYDSSDVESWVTAAIQRDARVVEVTDHPEHPGWFDLDVSVASYHLQQLKLWYARLGGTTLEDLSFQCPCLQVLELKECILEGSTNMSSDSLKSLSMENCRIWLGLSVNAPNLVSLRLVKPYNRAPSFSTMGSLATATIILVDSFLATKGYYICEEHSDHKLSLNYDDDENVSYKYDDFYGSYTESISTCQYGEPADDCDDEQSSADSEDCSRNGSKSRLGGYHGPNVFGGDKLLLSLLNATSLDLIAHLGEVILNRELKTCPTFSNLKSLFLGEWCMAGDFGPLASILDHCPNLERLSIELRSGNGKAVVMSNSKIPLSGGLLACAHLAKVKIIKCCKDDVRVNALVKLFVDSGMDIQKIYVRQTRKNCLLTSSTEVAL